MEAHFYKFHGAGNDFIILDNRWAAYEHTLTPHTIAALCAPHTGIGADGLILLSTPRQPQHAFHMHYYNADGQPGTMCGNGARCLLALASTLGLWQDACHFSAPGGDHHATWHQGQIALQMAAPPDVQPAQTPFFHHTTEAYAHTGSPHYVIFTQDNPQDWDLQAAGPQVRHHPRFAPQGGVNVNVAHVLAPGILQTRTFERGVEAETLSCGTGAVACAAAYAALRPFQDPQGPPTEAVEVRTQGGTLTVLLQHPRPILIGPALQTFQGTIDLQAYQPLPPGTPASYNPPTGHA